MKSRTPWLDLGVLKLGQLTRVYFCSIHTVFSIHPSRSPNSTRTSQRYHRLYVVTMAIVGTWCMCK